ncbi:DinB family protein [Deinococcus radiomollis]|uniref:DinB family protein n=1 Tax=Deinococcus radiomollis TaxID=468916 RepID=UPI00389283D9
MLTELVVLFTRDLDKLLTELAAYPSEESLWTVQGDISNSAGNLALHLIGNLSQFIGDDLGPVRYARDREAEFSRRGVPRSELLQGVRQVQELVQKTLGGLDASRLDQVHPRTPPGPGFPSDMTSGSFLLHLYGHLNYHLGQINYHRRLLGLQEDPSSAGQSGTLILPPSLTSGR